MTMTTEDDIRATLITLVRQQASVRDHRLSARQLDALETQTLASIRAMSAYLDGRPLRAGAAPLQPGAIAAQVAQATEAARAAAGQGASTFMTDGQLAATKPHMRAPEADKVQAEGYFLHDGKLYKVVRAIYGSGNLYAKRLDLDAGEFVMAKGMMSYLRESERINEEQAAEFGRSLEVTPEMGIYGKCLICGRPLTDEESIRNKVGPGPHKNA